jgi:hypothetical protein
MGDLAAPDLWRQAQWSIATLVKIFWPAVFGVGIWMLGARWAKYAMRQGWLGWVDTETQVRFEGMRSRIGELEERNDNRDREIARLKRENGSLKARQAAMVAAAHIGGR